MHLCGYVTTGITPYLEILIKGALMRVFDDIHSAYKGIIEDVLFDYDYLSSPRGLPCREKLDYSFKITNPVAETIVTLDESRNEKIKSYTAKEVELYNSCSNKVEDFAKASKFWNKIANPDGTVNSAYGYLIWGNKSHGSDFEQETIECPIMNMNYDGDGRIMKAVSKRRTPWEWCVESLKSDKDTRQAILRFSLPEHQWMGNKDQTCTMHGNFLIREDKLHLCIVMRSNDLMKGLVYDMPWFISLMDKMVEELKETYPNLEKGHYTHTVHSMHAYEQDKEAMLSMIGRKE
jgi:thymidylate synthase